MHRDPSALVAIDAWLADFAAARRIEFIDYHRALVNADGHLDAACSDDGLPNAAGYARMKDELRRSEALGSAVLGT